MSSGTRAFALDPARIYVNMKGRYPRGTVDGRDAGRILADIESLLLSTSVEGRSLVKKIFRKEEIYRGPCFGQAPDMVLIAEKGFNLRGNIKAGSFTEKTLFTGKHTQENAFLLLKGGFDPDRVPEEPDVTSVKAVLDSLGLN
jgi:predicted AlkP superfamily phosphohydrolase/phosphomutase